MTKVKICGITNATDLGLAIECGADAIGFITDVPVDTPRKIDAATAASLSKKVPVFVTSVLVTMPKSADEAISLIKKVRPRAVQIHSDLAVKEIQYLREQMDIPVIKTVGVSDFAGAISRINEVEDFADAILLDTVGDGPGGTGTTHDWRISAEIVRRCSIPVILAGGLRPENVFQAVSIVKPYAVDVASGVETNGRKDASKLNAFIREVKRASF
ncbi:MAG: phosphoribosylanthranilate isomerase [Methanocellales archaeon]|nr:phosphoribosylanthranilate isomerase [Methanocellales archaeon]